MNDTLQNTAEWFRKSTPSPTLKNISTQMGVHFEEVAEMIEALGPTTPEAKLLLDSAHAALENLSALMKRDQTAVMVRLSRQNDLLDSICDQIVTATGSGVFLGMNVPGALAEVNASNWSKFHNGECLRDENQKIIKGPDYFKPNLKPFLPE